MTTQLTEIKQTTLTPEEIDKLREVMLGTVGAIAFYFNDSDIQELFTAIQTIINEHK